MRESPALQQEFECLSALQNLVQSRGSRFDAPPHLASRVFAALPEARPVGTSKTVPSWWRPLAIGTTMAAVALLFWSIIPTLNRFGPSAGPREEVLAAHVRSLMADHLTDLTSAERHTVKPWLSSRLDFAPPVEDFASEGFALVGGRLDYLDGKPVAALVYRYRQHIINVFVGPWSENRQVSVQTLDSPWLQHSTLRFPRNELLGCVGPQPRRSPKARQSSPTPHPIDKNFDSFRTVPLVRA